MTYVNQLQFLKIFRSSHDMMRLEADGYVRRLVPIPVINADLPMGLDHPEWARIWSEASKDKSPTEGAQQSRGTTSPWVSAEHLIASKSCSWK